MMRRRITSLGSFTRNKADCPSLHQFKRDFIPDHQGVECHERDFPKYEEMIEASAEKDSIKSTLGENH